MLPHGLLMLLHDGFGDGLALWHPLCSAVGYDRRLTVPAIEYIH